MDAGAVAGCLRDKTVLVTGSTGYLGKLMVEKILRVQPDVKKVYLLVRAPDAASAEQRILTQVKWICVIAFDHTSYMQCYGHGLTFSCIVLGKDLFNTLREKHGLAGFQKLIKEKIVPLAGDVGTRNFGLDSSTSDDLCQEIDVIVHGAATTSFYERILEWRWKYRNRGDNINIRDTWLRSDFWGSTALNLSLEEPGEHCCKSSTKLTGYPYSHDKSMRVAYILPPSWYDVALASNALGAQYGCEFAKKCPNLKLLLHVSTAFVAGTQEGLLLEKALKMGEALRPGCHLDIEAELQLVEKVKAELAEAKSGGSDQSSEKIAMKELGFKRACHFGWPNVYTFTKAMGEMLLEQQRGDLPVVIIRPTMVTSTYQDPFPGWIEGARTIDALIVAYNEQAFPCFVGDRNDTMDAVPADMVVNATLVAMAVHWNEKGQVIYHVSSAIRNPLTGQVLEDVCWDYFSIHPRVLENGKPLENRRPYVFKRFAYFRAYLILMYKLPLEILHAVSVLLCGLFSQCYNKHNRRYTFLMLLVKLYAPYAFFKGCFDDTNLTRLRKEVKMDGKDGSLFNFDPKSMDWHSYLLNVHVPAVLMYGRKNKGSV
ncbi:unnamed protein product [Triticum turgidum subsp. durum]|uniref:Fatty acyl-CoA reductase n=1 Tax=Triticum turgidum subsp. durum TaxID=4567 RepID=A0A9R0TX62_TRITD|nr:unnamed protein product [Triticum turgidum subsp. durum]